MTDYGIFKARPAQERDELGFAKWRENQHIVTHGPGCHTWGRGHYDCALAEIERLSCHHRPACEECKRTTP